MTDPNHAQSAATRPAASLSRRLQRLMVVVVTALFGMTVSSLSFAASPPPSKTHSTTKPHAATPRPSAHPNATSSKSKAKAKPAVAQHPAQPRKTPTKTRVAAKSKTPTRAHQPARKPSKLAAKQTKHSA